MKTKFYLLIILFTAFCNGVFSQILWSNPITDTDPSTSNPYTTGDVTATGITVSGIGRGSGIIASTTADAYNASAWNTSTFDLNDYYSFILTPNASYSLNFVSFVFNAKISATGPANYALRSSIDGYSTNIATGNTSTTNTTVTIDLSAATFQNLGSSITFRLYAWNAGGSGGTFRINSFQFNGTAVSSLPTSSATDYFRSKTSGNWSNTSTWQSSADSVTWISATLVPDKNAASISIMNGHTVTIDANATAKYLLIKSGGILNHTNSISLTISNGTSGYDFVVDGTFVLNGTQPVMSGPSTAVIYGLVRADDNTNGESDDFARNSKVVFWNNSVFEWHTIQAFETASAGPTLYYFQSSGSMVPIFRITANIGNVGANNVTLFCGKFEVASGYTIKFQAAGTKAFRNGLGGDGTIYHLSTYGGAGSPCGTFLIGDGTAQTATIDGNLNIVVQSAVTSVSAVAASSDFVIATNATTTISGSPTITIGQYVFYVGPNAWVTSGAIFEVDGTLINNSPNPIDLTYGRLIDAGNISNSSTGSFKCSSTFTRIISAGTTANTSVGVLKLASGYSTVYSVEMGINASATVSPSHRIVLGTDVTVANNISLYQGVLVTDYKKLTLNYTAASSLNLPSVYTNSFIATCDQNGNALVSTGVSATTTTPFNGTVGFTINNLSGSSYVMFPIGYNFSRPNRMQLNPNSGATSVNVTVVVTSGDILNTPQPRVNRIWYVYTSNPGVNSNIGLRLYFTKYNWSVSSFGSGQDEIEDGFNYGLVDVGRRDYTTNPRLSHRSAINNLSAPAYNSEVYAEYMVGYTGPTTLPGYYKFAVGNFETIILPVSIVNVKAYKNGSNINIDWSALNELNTEHYEVERSTNGVAFSAVMQAKANNNGNTQNNYSAVDAHPINGNNFYRIKAVDKDGQIKYSAVVSVNINSNYVGIKVLPNPVNNRLMNVQLSNLPAGKYDLLLYSANGQRVYTTSFTFNGGFASQVFVLPPNIRTGAYVLKLFNGANKFTQNIMVE